MAKRKKASAGGAGAGALKRTLFCPMCGVSMAKAQTIPHQHTRDDQGRLVEVTRVFYWCPKDGCHSVVHFDYREDGRRGDLSWKLEAQKKLGFNPDGGMTLSGEFDKLE